MIARFRMRILFRLLSLFALAISVIMAVVDATRSVAVSAWTFTPLMESWRATWPDMLEAVRRAIESRALPFLWDPVLIYVLSLPGWLVFAVLALVFHAIGHRRYRPGESLAAPL